MPTPHGVVSLPLSPKRIPGIPAHLMTPVAPSRRVASFDFERSSPGRWRGASRHHLPRAQAAVWVTRRREASAAAEVGAKTVVAASNAGTGDTRASGGGAWAGLSGREWPMGVGTRLHARGRLRACACTPRWRNQRMNQRMNRRMVRPKEKKESA
eukprot:895345-Pleurochrysis_carterae.AAC.2